MVVGKRSPFSVFTAFALGVVVSGFFSAVYLVLDHFFLFGHTPQKKINEVSVPTWVAQTSGPLFDPPNGGALGKKDPVIDAAVKALVEDKTMHDARIGVAVMDVATGQFLAVYNEYVPLNPASNAKVYTAAAALSLLHANYRYQTRLLGKMKSDVVVEGLVLKGYGDPSLDDAKMGDLALDLQSRGVKRVEGDISVDHLFFDDETTPPAFEQQPNEWAYFRAPISALSVNENTVTMVVRPGEVGEPASVHFLPPGFVEAQGHIKTAESGADTVSLELSGTEKGLHAKLGGSVARDSAVVKYVRRVEDPRLLGGFVLKRALIDLGIDVSGTVKLGRAASSTTLSKRDSEPLSSLLYRLGKQSDNFYAEMIFRSLGAETKSNVGSASSKDAVEAVTSWLIKNQLWDEGMVIKNGSGLFDANRATANSMVKVLRKMYQDPSNQAEFVSQFAIGGVDGSLAGRFREWRSLRVVRAKTGTLADVIALSGYVLGPPDRGPVAFSILFNNVAKRAASARAASERLVSQIAEKLWADVEKR